MSTTTTTTASRLPTSWALTETSFPAFAADVRSRALILGGGALLLTVLGGFFMPWAFFPAYLAAYLFVLGFGLGSLGLLLLHNLVGGLWGFVIRRPLEAASATLPVLALLFLPILLGMHTLYEWSVAERVHESAALQWKSGYLNVPFWIGRAVVYHLIWSGLALLVRRNSMRQDETEDPAPTRATQAFAGPALLVMFVSVTFAAIDWGMSIEPEWYSTIYGVMLIIGFILSALSLAVITATALREVPPLSTLARAEGFHDLGNLMLAFTMLWAYMSFSQYLLIWMGNLAEEVPWYLRRSYGGWRVVAGALMVFHFFVPFFLLLIRENKRTAARLWLVAAWVLLMHLMNDTWLILPAFTEAEKGTRWGTLIAVACVPLAVLGVGGVWAAAYAWLLPSRPLLPRHDPMLAVVLDHLAHDDHAPPPGHGHGHEGGGH